MATIIIIIIIITIIIITFLSTFSFLATIMTDQVL